MNVLFPVSICVQRREKNGGLDTRHSAFLANAVSKDEAIGKGLRMALKLYPMSEGWASHSVNVGVPDTPIEPEEAFVTVGNT